MVEKGRRVVYYVGASNNSDFLEHYGRKGMKWGKHIFVYKKSESSNRVKSAVQNRNVGSKVTRSNSGKTSSNGYGGGANTLRDPKYLIDQSNRIAVFLDRHEASGDYDGYFKSLNKDIRSGLVADLTYKIDETSKTVTITCTMRSGKTIEKKFEYGSPK